MLAWWAVCKINKRFSTSAPRKGNFAVNSGRVQPMESSRVPMEGTFQAHPSLPSQAISHPPSPEPGPVFLPRSLSKNPTFPTNISSTSSDTKQAGETWPMPRDLRAQPHFPAFDSNQTQTDGPALCLNHLAAEVFCLLLIRKKKKKKNSDNLVIPT